MPCHRAGTVGLLQAVEIPALDNARVALALAGACNVHPLAGFKCVGLDKVAHIQGADVLQAELPKGLLGGDAALLEVARKGLCDPLGLLVPEADLYRVIAVGLHGLLLGHDAGPGLYHCYRDDLTLVVEDLRHADLLSDDPFFHVLLPFYS